MHQMRSSITRIGWFTVSGTIVLLGASGCSSDHPPTEPNARPSATANWQGPPLGHLLGPTEIQGPTRNPDEEFAAIAAQVSGFGGFYRDTATGKFVMYLVDTAKKGAARAALAASFSARGLSPDTPIDVRPGKYDFRDLKRWKDDLTVPILSLPGAQFIGANSPRNRVLIGIENEAARAPIIAAIAKLGVPLDAIDFEVTGEKVSFTTSLTDYQRPPYGGVQIGNDEGALCTEAVTVWLDGVSGRFGLTPSHCTDYVHGYTGGPLTTFYQPFIGVDSLRIGTEYKNPVFSLCGPPPGETGTWYCRGSDAALYQLNGTMPYTTAGLIVRTQSRGSTSGSIVQDPNFPWFYVEAVDGYPWYAGQVLNKIGRTTGWTYGAVTSDGLCVNTAVEDKHSLIYCSYYVNAGVGPGDSGSPVFSWDGSRVQVTLFGMLWGGFLPVGGGNGTKFIMSPWGKMTETTELGPMHAVCCP
jgi:hypothetical protein